MSRSTSFTTPKGLRANILRKKKYEIVDYFNSQLDKIQLDDISSEERDFLWKTMLTMYANPLKNKLRSLLGGME